MSSDDAHFFGLHHNQAYWSDESRPSTPGLVAYARQTLETPVSHSFHGPLDQRRKGHRRTRSEGIPVNPWELLDSMSERVRKCEEALDAIENARFEKKLENNHNNILRVMIQMTDVRNFMEETRKSLSDRHSHDPLTCETCFSKQPFLDYTRGAPYIPHQRIHPIARPQH
ncbi:hypothetical protein BDN72DRAFT_902157 [Pluteus cervinus]|uniref:Uncharacterized protein n=1 Tax=Pluteus cervinus TaxID=181527 RepID=A0ACD3ADC8_9AGAR|nr:hypothetical protein BDN72DRAFT_902157 [Pluteus cervinus]